MQQPPPSISQSSSSQQLPRTKTPSYQRNKLLTLLGSLIVQFSSGLIPVWGNANLYFLSYFKNNGEEVNKNTNSWILLATVIPMCVFIVFAAKLGTYFGYTRMIRLCAVVYFLSYLMVYVKFNMTMCTIFLLIIPITVNSMSFVPMYNCLWSYFPQKKSTVTGYVLVSYGISGVVFNLLFLHLVNPDNLEAKLKDNDGFVYFAQDVTDNLLFTVKVIYCIVGLLFLIGAWMIRREDEQQQNANTQKQSLQLKVIELKEMKHAFGHQQKEDNDDDGNKRYELKQEQAEGQQPQQQHKYHTIDSPGLISSHSHHEPPQPQPSLSPQALSPFLFSPKFIIIFCTVLFIDFYATYLLTNFKLIYIDSINDDHFLGYCLVANTVTAILGTFVWGWLGDRRGFGKTMLYIVATDLCVKIIGIVSYKSKPMLFTLMLLLGLTSRGMSTVAGPGLVEVFGLKIATQLLPIKALAVIGSMVFVPILQLLFLSLMSPFQFMNLLILINLFLLASSIYFVNNFSPQLKNVKAQGGQRERQQ